MYSPGCVYTACISPRSYIAGAYNQLTTSLTCETVGLRARHLPRYWPPTYMLSLIHKAQNKDGCKQVVISRGMLAPVIALVEIIIAHLPRACLSISRASAAVTLPFPSISRLRSSGNNFTDILSAASASTSVTLPSPL